MLKTTILLITITAILTLAGCSPCILAECPDDSLNPTTNLQPDTITGPPSTYP